MSYTRRRELITLLGGAIAWPIGAEAQQSRVRVLGFLASASEAGYTATAAAVRSGLNEAGYVEKQNLLIEYRWADFQYERLPALAAELVKRPVDAIFATGGRGALPVHSCSAHSGMAGCELALRARRSASGKLTLSPLKA
jgi:putative tryptophan/tyrosine transport system substrate-binding protein